MNNTWKLSILGAVAIVASAAVASVGCTVTSTTSTDDGGTTGDASHSDAGGGNDTGTADTGGNDGGGTCSATQACPIIASSNGVTFDTPSCGTCDKCSATKCCAEVTKCFTQVDGGPSECEELFTCILACAQADGGDQCKAACKAAHSQQAFDDLTAADNCQSMNCTMECK